MDISYKNLPSNNSIFIDYIYNFQKLNKFYESYYEKKENYEYIIKHQLENYSSKRNFSRELLADILKIQNKFFNSSEKTFDNIELLRSKKTFAVVTGQQAGFLSGNYYTVIKAINSVQLSELLRKWYPEYNFVPVFWLEADDHDFLEINNINIISRTSEIINIKWFENSTEQERYLKPVHSIIFDDSINNFKYELKKNLTSTEFTETIFDYVSRSYKAGIDIKTAFARFMNYILRDYGIIFCDPTDGEIKKLLIPVFEKELNTYPQTCEIVINTSAVIEQNYEPQAKPRPINLFYVYNGHRYPIEPAEENKLSLRYSRQDFSKEEFFENLYLNPEKFSSNVILRPICQDYLLPTVTYIGGPSEVAYFSQLRFVYDFYNLKMPVIFPRTSVTLLENKVINFIDKYKLTVEDLFRGEDLLTKFMSIINQIKIVDIFNNFTDEFNSLMYNLEQELLNVDNNLVENLKNKNSKFLDSLNVIKLKFINSQVRQNEAAVEKLKTIVNNVYPLQTYQERFFNIVYYINKYGIDFCDYLRDKIDINSKSHQFIELKFKVTEI